MARRRRRVLLCYPITIEKENNIPGEQKRTRHNEGNLLPLWTLVEPDAEREKQWGQGQHIAIDTIKAAARKGQEE